MHIRSETHSDFGAVRRVLVAAFGSDNVADMVERIRASAQYDPELALVAEADGVVHGYVLVSGALLRAPDGSVRPIANLSPLAVDPSQQRQGIGGSLIRAATERAEDLGKPFVVLEGDHLYYSRFGFEHSTRYAIEIHLPDGVRPESAQVLRLASYNPTWSGMVVYPPAFDGV